MRQPLRVLASITVLIILAANPAAAQDDAPGAATDPAAAATEAAPPEPTGPPPPPIYEEQLLRLSEILGSLSFLRDLCAEKDGAVWRDEMNALLTAERPDPQRRTRLVGSFNHGFETLNAVYRACTPSARLAITHYVAEGRKLSGEVRSRYSQ